MPEALRRVGHGLAVLTQGRESQGAAEVGVGVGGIEPDGLLEVAQRRASAASVARTKRAAPGSLGDARDRGCRAIASVWSSIAPW